MDGLGPAGPSRLDDALDVQIALGGRARADQPRLVGPPHVQRSAIGLGINGDGSDAELTQRANDPNGDLAAIGDEHLAERRRHGRGSLEPDGVPRGFRGHTAATSRRRGDAAGAAK